MKDTKIILGILLIISIILTGCVGEQITSTNNTGLLGKTVNESNTYLGISNKDNNDTIYLPPKILSDNAYIEVAVNDGHIIKILECMNGTLQISNNTIYCEGKLNNDD